MSCIRVPHGWVLPAATMFLLYGGTFSSTHAAAAFPSGYEQYLLELVNRGRLDPTAEAVRYGTALNEGLTAGTISADPKQPLAFNHNLVDAAQGHSLWMLNNDTFSHTGAGGSNPGGRMASAGYTFAGSWYWGENISLTYATWEFDLTAAVAGMHEGLYVDDNYPGRGHRVNLMNPSFREIGIGVITGDYLGYYAATASEDFAHSGSDIFLTGVVYDDSLVLQDGFYSPGEGLGGVDLHAVSAADGADFQAATWDSGGYSLALPPGTYRVTASGGGLTGELAREGVVVSDQNVKVDFTPISTADDICVYRDGAWLFYSYETGGTDFSVWTGSSPGCIPVPIDYDGDGVREFSVFCNGAWHFFDDDGYYLKGIWTGGAPGDRPVPADYDGDGTDEVVVFSGGAWMFYDFATGAWERGVWTGAPSHWYGGTPVAVPMDYDGDGAADFTVYSGGPWHFFNDDGSYRKGIWTGAVFGDVPVPADYDGDGTDEVVVFRDGAWMFHDFATGAWDGGVWTGSPPHWNGGTSLPAPLDYDGDGAADFTVYSGGPWHFFTFDGNYDKGIWTGGVAGDKPLSRRLLTEE